MVVKELRDVIKGYNDSEKEKIIVELYKRIPKRVKEDYEVDDFIIKLREQDKSKKKDKEVIDIDNLAKEVTYFIECANNDLYSSANRIISKKERQGWRFKVKRYYKELNSFLPDTPEGDRATVLLAEIYKLLSYGSHYLVFSNWETFKALGVSQADFLETIMMRELSKGVNSETIRFCVQLLDVKYDPNGYYGDMIDAFIYCLKTVEDKSLAIEELKIKNEELEERYFENNRRRNSKLAYECSVLVNYFVELIVRLYFDLSEVKEAIKYFHGNYIEDIREIKEYILLELLESKELYSYWVEEYEKHINKIDYRDSLKENYEEFKKKI